MLKKIIAVLLSLTMFVSLFTTSAFALDDEKDLKKYQIECEYFVNNKFNTTTVEGFLKDNQLYVSPKTIEKLSGYLLSQNKNGTNLTYRQDGLTTVFFEFNCKSGVLKRHISSSSNILENNVSVLKSAQKKYYINLEEMLRGMNVKIEISADKERPLKIVSEKKLINIYADYVKAKGDRIFFDWEMASDKGYKTLEGTSNINDLITLFYDYNGHFISDTANLLSGNANDMLSASEEMQMDSMFDILTTMKNISVDSNDNFFQILDDSGALNFIGDYGGLTFENLSLFDNINIPELQSFSNLFGAVSTASVGLSYLNSYACYSSMTQAQKNLIPSLFVDFPFYQKDDLSVLYNAAVHLKDRISTSLEGPLSVTGDALIDIAENLGKDYIASAHPILLAIKASEIAVKLIPFTADYFEGKEHISMACHQYMLMMLCQGVNVISWEDACSVDGWTNQYNMEQLKNAMLFHILSSISVYNNFLSSSKLDSGTKDKIKRNMAALINLFMKVSSASTSEWVCDNTAKIDWVTLTPTLNSKYNGSGSTVTNTEGNTEGNTEESSKESLSNGNGNVSGTNVSGDTVINSSAFVSPATTENKTITSPKCKVVKYSDYLTSGEGEVVFKFVAEKTCQECLVGEKLPDNALVDIFSSNDGNILTEVYNQGSSWTYNVVKGETYYIKIATWDFTGKFTLARYIQKDELDISNATIVNDKIEYYGETFTYKFTAPRTGYYEFILTNFSRKNVSAFIYDYNSPSESLAGSNCTYGDDPISVFLKAGQSYQISICQSLHDMGEYSLKIMYPKPTYDITKVNKVSDELSFDSQTNTYTITPSGNKTLRFSFDQIDEGMTLYLKVNDSNSKDIGTLYDQTDVLECELVAGRTYTVSVNGDSSRGKYTFLIENIT